MTHHAPSWEVLTAGGLVRLPVERNWLRSITSKLSVVERPFFENGSDGSGTYRLGCYASPLTRSCGTNAGDVVWMRPHACTPILRSANAPVSSAIRGYSRGGIWERSERVGFDERFVVDTADGGVMPI